MGFWQLIGNNCILKRAICKIVYARMSREHLISNTETNKLRKTGDVSSAESIRIRSRMLRHGNSDIIHLKV